MQNFWKAISQITPLSEKSKGEMEKICTVQMHEKHEFILRQGAVCDGFYYVDKGLVRIFYYKHGKEITEWFALDNTFCFSIISFFKKLPSQLAIQCLENCRIVTISRDGINELSNSNLEISKLFREMISMSLIASQYRMDSMLFETAKQRYDNLIKLYPSIIKRAPLQYIASYLGINAETLSRIRNQQD